MLVAGVDEAGRGSLLGPLVVAGIAIDASKLDGLREAGVKDSKKLSPEARERLYRKILRLADSYYVYKAQPRTVDRFVSRRKLNVLEADAFAGIINRLRPDVAYVDSCDVIPERFGRTIMSMLRCRARINSSHHADANNIAVSAASIIAKVNRDREMIKIRKKHGRVGSGYPSDVRTMRFVRRWVRSKRKAPSFARRSWRPLRELLVELSKRHASVRTRKS